MKRRTFFLSLVGGATLGWAGWKSASNECLADTKTNRGRVAKVSRSRWALGAQVRITAFHSDPTYAEQTIESAFKELELIESLMSLYRPDSQLCQLNRDGVLYHPHPYLVEVLKTAGELSRKTAGAFDVTIQPLYQLYAKAGAEGMAPTADTLSKAIQLVDWRRVKVFEDFIRLDGVGTEITLNGIAQGFATDAVVRSLKRSGIEHALIDAGEIGSLGRHADNRDWSVGIKHPRKPDDLFGLAKLEGRSLATSGDYETRFSEGYKHHHLLNPHTGHSANEMSSVSIAAPTALQADALSTAVFILGLQEGMRLIASTPQADALIIGKRGQITKTHQFPFTT